MFSILLTELCIRLRTRHTLALGAWYCERVLSQIESVELSEGDEALRAERLLRPSCAPVFEQLLMAKLRGGYEDLRGVATEQPTRQKWDAGTFRNMTGWADPTGRRTNEHARDAGRLVFGRSYLW